MYVVTQNGRVIDRGFRTAQEAWRWTNDYVKGLESHKAGSRIYTPEFEIAEDQQNRKEADQLWRDCKTHTMVTRP